MFQETLSNPHVPDKCRALADVIGARYAAKLCDRYSGAKYNVPAVGGVDGLRLGDLPGSSQKVTRIIGTDALMQLCEVYGGMRLVIPDARVWYLRTREHMIRADHAAGMHVRSIAQKYSMMCDTVFRILGIDAPEVL